LLNEMAGLDSGIKCCKDVEHEIELLESKKSPYAFLIMQIKKKASGKGDEVQVVEKVTKEECEKEAAENAGDRGTFKGSFGEQVEDDRWFVFRRHLAAFNKANDFAYGLCFFSCKEDNQFLRPVEKLVYVKMNTPNATVKQKMIYSSTKVKVKSMEKDIETDDLDDLEFKTLMKDKKLVKQ